jgi:hypothetical protein
MSGSGSATALYPLLDMVIKGSCTGRPVSGSGTALYPLLYMMMEGSCTGRPVSGSASALYPLLEMMMEGSFVLPGLCRAVQLPFILFLI